MTANGPDGAAFVVEPAVAELVDAGFGVELSVGAVPTSVPPPHPTAMSKASMTLHGITRDILERSCPTPRTLANVNADGADLLQLKRLGGWSRWEMVERYSHAIPVRDREALPNPVAKASSNASKSQPPVRGPSALTRLSA